MRKENQNDSPRKAAAALIEVNKVLRNKLRKASSLLKQKSEKISQLENSGVSFNKLNEVEEKYSIVKEKNKELEVEISILREQTDLLSDTSQNEEIQKYKKSLVVLQKQLKMASMHIQGIESELEAFKNNHPESDLLEKTADVFKNGKSKSKSRVIYEVAFDERAKELGIIDPAQYRP